jgi:hypothetical protein
MGKKMTPSQKAKAAGFNAVEEMAEYLPYNARGLYYMSKRDPSKFDDMILLAKVKRNLAEDFNSLPWFLQEQVG